MTCTDIASLAPLYISGELGETRAATFSDHLETCRTCAEEIARQIDVDERLRDFVFAEDVESSSVKNRVRGIIASESGRPAEAPMSNRARWAWGAGIAAAVLLAFGGYRVAPGARPAPVFAAAARDHHSEVVEQQRRVWQQDRTAVEALAVRNGVSPDVIQTLGGPGFRLERGKLCRLEGRVYLHLVLSDGTHEISAFFRPRESDVLPASVKETVDGRGLCESRIGASEVALFQTGEVTAIVVAENSKEAALHLARFAAAAL